MCLNNMYFYSRLLTTELDNSIQYQAPELTSLTPFEMAALRDGRKGIIHTALFSFWQHQRITTSGKMQEAKISSISSKPPQNEFEQILFSFIASSPVKPTSPNKKRIHYFHCISVCFP